MAKRRKPLEDTARRAVSLVFDERRYLLDYPDVAEAISRGQFKSALHHFFGHGRREQRRYPLPTNLTKLLGREREASRSYRQFIERVEQPEIDRIEARLPERLSLVERAPRISILIPVFDPEQAHLEACLESATWQSYENIEICVVDDASTKTYVLEVIERFAARDARVRFMRRDSNGNICAASNDALALSSGDFVALLDHDDVLPRHALLVMAEALLANPDTVLLYGDEDKLGRDGLRRYPHFKPDYSPDLLLGQNYICHLLVARRDAVVACGGFRSGYEGSQDHDLVLRLTDGIAPEKVVHVPFITYHWRETERSTALRSDAKPYAERAGLAAVRDAIARRSLAAEADHARHARGTYHVRFGLPEPLPRVSILIPTRDRVDLLRRCVESIRERTDYDDIEIVVVDNESIEPETRRYLEDLARRPDTLVVRAPGRFNFPALNNLAAEAATGSILALVNNDVEALEPSWLREIVSHAVRPDVGCVGAKLCYPDGRIQHAGISLSPHNVAENIQPFSMPDNLGYFGRFSVTHEVSAVTAACLVVRRQTYFDFGGLDHVSLPVAYNDVDFCLRLRSAGLRVLFTPHALLQHDESATRGSDRRGSSARRLKREADVMRGRWGTALVRDRFYSARATLSGQTPHQDDSTSPTATPPDAPAIGEAAPDMDAGELVAVIRADRDAIIDSVQLLRQEVAHELALTITKKKRIDRLFELFVRDLNGLDLFSLREGRRPRLAEPSQSSQEGHADEARFAQLSRELTRVQSELQAIHASKLWKAASLYWKLLHALSLMRSDGRRTTSTESKGD